MLCGRWMPEYFMGLILCPKNKIWLETAHPELRRTSPQYSTNTLYGQIQPAQALSGKNKEDVTVIRVFLLSTSIISRALPALAMERSPTA